MFRRIDLTLHRRGHKRRVNLSDFDNLNHVFQIDGEPMQTHPGRSVVRLNIDGQTCFLKRYWLIGRQVFRRFIAQGLHELAMIDWLNANGFSGPEVVARGVATRLGIRTRMFFLMRQVEDELPLERFYRRNREAVDELTRSLAEHTARLHDAGFYHRDYSERHIFVGRATERLTFRQIDLERASQGVRQEPNAAADLKTLACSIANEDLRTLIEGDFVDRYLECRKTAPPRDTFLQMLAAAQPTKTFE